MTGREPIGVTHPNFHLTRDLAADWRSEIVVMSSAELTDLVGRAVSVALSASQPSSEPLVYSVVEAAKRLRLSESTVRALIESGQLGCRRVGKRVLVGARHLDEFLSAESDESIGRAG